MSTVVTLKVTPFSHSTMNRRWEKGQLPMLWPSLPAYGQEEGVEMKTLYKVSFTLGHLASQVEKKPYLNPV